MKSKSKVINHEKGPSQTMPESVGDNEVIDAIRRGLKDVKAGRTKSARQALKEIRHKYGIVREARELTE